MAARKRDELNSKLQAVPNELKRWVELSENNQPFEKHHSQIRKLAPQIEGLHSAIAEDLKNLMDNDENLLREARKLETRMLAVHSVWDYFRSKFVLRAQEPFAKFLKAADAFAWACYEPVQKAHKEAGGKDMREPPLVVLQNLWSPSALPRDHAYNIARAPGGWTDTKPFVDVIESLPLPILGLPWFHLEHLPHVVLLAHEVGHVVEHDFGLEDTVEAVVRTAPLTDESRRDAWVSWRKEVFADWFGCYAAGPAFVWALAEVLASGVAGIINEKKQDTWGDYPTTTLRVCFNRAALRLLGWTEDADDIEKEWTSTYASHQMGHFEADAAVVAEALKGGTLLPDALLYNRVRPQENRSVEIVSLSPNITELTDTSLRDARALIAAAGTLYRATPSNALTRKHWEKLRQRIVTARPPGLLAPPVTTATDEEAEKQKGRALAAEFFSALDEVTTP